MTVRVCHYEQHLHVNTVHEYYDNTDDSHAGVSTAGNDDSVEGNETIQGEHKGQDEEEKERKTSEVE